MAPNRCQCKQKNDAMSVCAMADRKRDACSRVTSSKMPAQRSINLFSPSITILMTLLLTLFMGVNGQQELTLQFTQSEEQAVGQFVGSVSTSSIVTDRVGQDERPGLRYNILRQGYEHSDLFDIGQVSGNLTFAGRVDREAVCPSSRAVCELEFPVAVSGATFLTIMVKVTITDINDNSPRFPPPSTVDITIAESVNQNLSLVTATDADGSDPFGEITYDIVPPSNIFKVHLSRNLVGTPQLSLILNQPLDREENDSYSFLVLAKDGGNPARTGTLTVNIKVTDVNDNAPEFTQTYYTANFSENAGPGYEIIRVNATDKDAASNGRVVYLLSSSADGNTAEIRQKVAVDKLSGVVSLKESLGSGQYRIYIEARDLGEPPKSNQAVVIATVIDTDNNQPTIQVNPVKVGDLPLGWVSEGSKISTPVAVLDVGDPDSGSNGNVSCTSLDPSFQLQQISQQQSRGSYKLIVARELDREKNSTHLVTVICSDHGTPSLNASAEIKIQVQDINDNVPIFSQPQYSQNFLENRFPGETVLVVHALDADIDENKRIEYRVANTGGNFTVTPDTGVVKANRKFDREVKDRYEFTVLAVDFGSPRKTGYATVIVNILDINDEAPSFSNDNYTFTVYENKNPGIVVGNVTATDPDLNEGGEVKLSLQPVTEDEEVPFTINSEGLISSGAVFDREDQDAYIFQVVAQDSGPNPHFTTAMVTVKVLDMNDNEPTFVFPSEQNFSAYVNIPIGIGAAILQVDVFDKDINQNGIISYAIVASNASGLFRIGRFSGEIIANKDLGLQDVATYALTINATDQGEPLRWQARTLNLVVQSESARADDVIADQNVLIVACIVCFTVIVFGAVVVAICILRRLDSQRKLQYSSSCCPDNRAESDNGSTIGEGVGQYDSAPNAKDHVIKQDSNSQYHQKRGNYQQAPPPPYAGSSNNSNHSTFKIEPSRDYSSGGNSSTSQPGPNYYSVNQRNQTSETTVSRPHDDFHSTSSTETATGDSGHGSDEEISLEHPSIVGIDPSKAPISGDVFKASPLRLSIGGSSSVSQARSERPAMIRNPPPSMRSKANSVRFDPNVTDIYEMPLKSLSNPSIHRQNSNNSSSNVVPPRPPRAATKRQPSQTSSNSPYNQIMPQIQTHLPTNLLHNRPQQQQQQQQQQQPQLPGGKHAILMTRLPPSKPQYHQQLQRPNISSLSQSSFGDDNEDNNSDMNTTTSGSYSVASDDVARLASLDNVRDLYV